MPDEPITVEERTLLKMYEEGSETCRNYSRLTMQIRSAVSLVLAGGAGAIIIKGAPSSDDGPLFLVLIGALTAGLTIALALTNWHYQSAFEAIRDQLARIEERLCNNGNILPDQPIGPWIKHACIRDSWSDAVASFLPFIVLGMFSLGALSLGLYKMPAHVSTWWIWPALVFAGFIAIGILLAYSDRNNKDCPKENAAPNNS